MTARKKVIATNKTNYADVLNKTEAPRKGFTRKEWRKFTDAIEDREVEAILNREKSPLLAMRKRAKKRADKILAAIKKAKKNGSK